MSHHHHSVAPGVDLPESAAPASTIKPRMVDSSSVLQGANEVLIKHGTETYRLRVTKAGKLILQK